MESLVPWFILKDMPGIGDITLKRLIALFGDAQNVLNANYDELTEKARLNIETAEAVCRAPRITDRIKRELELIDAASVKVVTLADAAYPSLLKEIADPPPLLYVKGKLDNLAFPLAIVGARKPTEYGVVTTRKLSRELTLKGFSIISGLAVGIDAEAHKGALDVQGTTFAVLGNGLSSVYPRENRQLAKQIIEFGGALISELHMKAPPDAFHFPKRNRIISGISMGTVVTEAASKSGSLITARLALEQNREVFAVPGSIQSSFSNGCHYLLKCGAKLVENDADIIEELGGSLTALLSECQTRLPAKEKNIAEILRNSIYPVPDLEKLYREINANPQHIDALCRKFQKPAATMLGMLMELELEDLVQKLPGDFYIKEDIS